MRIMNTGGSQVRAGLFCEAVVNCHLPGVKKHITYIHNIYIFFIHTYILIKH